MRRGIQASLCALVLLLLLIGGASAAGTGTGTGTGTEAPSKENMDLTPRLQEIYELRARWLHNDPAAPPIEGDYLQDLKTAKWALDHEHGKLRYMKKWAENRGVTVVEAKPYIKVQYLKSTPDRVRFYVAQSLQLGYQYPGEEQINRFGVGTRHIIELRREGDRWLIGMEWYTDPLGDDTEVPDVTPASTSSPAEVDTPVAMQVAPTAVANRPASQQVAQQGYDRQGAVAYANQYCGMAWGCGNENKYNPKYKDYNGVGGDCTNFTSQALKQGGKLNMPIFTRVDSLVSHLRYSGKADLVAKETFQPLWKLAASKPQGFQAFMKEGDLIAYQEKGKMEHSAIVTGFDSRGYPLVNSHTADRFQVPFDLGWDRKTVYWLLHLRD